MKVWLQGILIEDTLMGNSSPNDRGAETTTPYLSASGQRSQQHSGLIRRKTVSVGMICSFGSSGAIHVSCENTMGDSEYDSDIRNCNS